MRSISPKRNILKALQTCSPNSRLQESGLKLLFNTKVIDEATFKTYRNLCGRIQRMLTSSCITIEKKIDNKSFSNIYPGL